MRPIDIQPIRLARVTESLSSAQAGQPAGLVPNSEQTAVEVTRSELLDKGDAPIDVERVAKIRKAIADGTYPLVPAKIADALLASSILLRSPR